MGSATPIEDTIRAKITAALNPMTLEIYNDSHLHSHHKAMQGSTSKETHFRDGRERRIPMSFTARTSLTDRSHAISLVITSDAFKSKMQPARHRMIYALLSEEMAREGGIHALQLRTLTPEEEARQQQKKDQEATTTAAKEAAPNDDA
ncbi:BolA domain protein [Beauveria brongniartii RCEF 3172]|uniref:BolA domain protein n=1 Tax=Beauveria brongniartii RCEF 3172 TaxID=1081107 RepID=A0A167C7R1_9HYPO|nr:BolA domain protein [Beauveria brongniartii RCEF 3172]